MKSLVIGLILLVMLIPISFAKEVAIPELFQITSEASSIQEGKEVYFYVGSDLVASLDNELKYTYNNRLGSDFESKTLPFGEPILTENRFSFTGKELDQEFYYFSTRYYDSNLGRFNSVDPVKENQPYSYVENNPMNLVDPDGESPYDIESSIKSVGEYLKELKKGPYRFVQRDIRNVNQYDYNSYLYRSSICSLACSYAGLDSLSGDDQQFSDFIRGGIKKGIIDSKVGLVNMGGLFRYIENNFNDISAESLSYSPSDIKSKDYFWDLERRLMDGQIIVLNVVNLKGVPGRGLAYPHGHYLILSGTYISGTERSFRISDPGTGSRYYLSEKDLLGGWAWKGYRGFTLENKQEDYTPEGVSVISDNLGANGGNFYETFNFKF